MHPHNTIAKSLLALLLFTTVVSGYAGSEKSHSHDAIVEVVKTYLLQSVAKGNSQASVAVTPLDHRLKLKQCDAPLQAFSPPGGSKMGRTSVGVRCESPAPWSIYVSARIALEIPVVTATRDLARGQAISRADIILETTDTTRLLRGYYESIDQVVGRTLKRGLQRGKAVTPSLLVVQKTVQRGEQVTILAATGAIEVRMQGKAMKNGNPGDLIPVVNVKSKKELQARVVSEGLVRVD
ncbi:MAG: flagellar basal body P-ring formation chaperone FlgA [Candidatus Thiodiazotropha sp.]